MKIIEIDLTNKDPDKDLEGFFADNPLESGDKLQILVNDDPGSVVVTSVLIYSIATILLMKTSNKDRIAKEIFHHLQTSDTSLDFISRELEDKTGIKIDIEPQPSASRDPFAMTVGIWEDEDISPEKIRREAWRNYEEEDHEDPDFIF